MTMPVLPNEHKSFYQPIHGSEELSTLLQDGNELRTLLQKDESVGLFTSAYDWFFPRSAEDRAYSELEKSCRKVNFDSVRTRSAMSFSDMRVELKSEENSLSQSQQKDIISILARRAAINAGLKTDDLTSGPYGSESRFVYVGFDCDSLGSFIGRGWDKVCSVIDFIEDAGLALRNKPRLVIDKPREVIVKNLDGMKMVIKAKRESLATPPKEVKADPVKIEN